MHAIVGPLSRRRAFAPAHPPVLGIHESVQAEHPQRSVARGIRSRLTAFLCDGFPAIMNILEEHRERPAIPQNLNHAAGTRTVASDLDDGTRGNGNGDSLAIDRIDAKRLGLQSKAFASGQCVTCTRNYSSQIPN